MGLGGKIIFWVVLIMVVVWIFSSPGPHGNDLHTWVTDLFTFGGHAMGG